MEMDMCKLMGSPRVVDAVSLDALADETRDFMPPSEARRNRGAVARVVHMAQDRPDLDVAACTLSKTIGRPRQGEVSVNRVCRYIKGRTRYVQVRARVALSTGEVEWYAQVRDLQEMLSMKYIVEEL